MQKIKLLFVYTSCLVFITLSSSWNQKVNPKDVNKYSALNKKSLTSDEYDNGYIKGLGLGEGHKSSLFADLYARALEGDRVEYAEGMLDGYNVGISSYSWQGGLGNGNPTDQWGCKIVFGGNASLVTYLNSLGFGCYVSLEN